MMRLLLIGNQNSGKTTLFNRITGGRRHVGNFPGVTVDLGVGAVKNYKDVEIVDLPGIYSLTPYSNEETVTLQALAQKPDCIVNIVDATTLSRNLYLTMQLLETQIPMIIALNMMDEVRQNGTVIDVDALSELLGTTVVPISAAKNQGVDELCEKAVRLARTPNRNRFKDLCSGPLHTVLHSVAHLIENNAKQLGLPPKYCAIKLIENDADMIAKLNLGVNQTEIVRHFVEEIEQKLGTDRESAIVDLRYDNIAEICAAVIKKEGQNVNRLRADKIDRILTHRIWAIPIFLGVMGLIFYLTFGLIGKYLSDGFSYLIDLAANGLDDLFVRLEVSEWLRSLVVNGLFAGVGSVLSFLPTIVVLFFFLSVIEDTGYMARVAFVMDNLMRKIGLSGRSIVPLLIGFGCSVPAYLATRTLSSERDRKLTIFMVPFMSCSAKIPIYAVFTMAFFPKYRALIMLFLYVFGILLQIVYALILQKTAFKGQSVPFVMELPAYRFPSAKSVLLNMWDKAKDFLVRAFTIILLASVVVWFLRSFTPTFHFTQNSEDSILAAVAKLIAPVFIPLGFGDWRAATSVIVGITAKEAVVSTLAVLMGVTQAELGGVLSALFSPVQAMSFLVFCSLYMPCVAAFATARKELGSTRVAVAAMALQTLIAYLAAALIYGLGLLFTL